MSWIYQRMSFSALILILQHGKTASPSRPASNAIVERWMFRVRALSVYSKPVMALFQLPSDDDAINCDDFDFDVGLSTLAWHPLWGTTANPTQFGKYVAT
ncbi:hypothetical protein VC83_07024 [Pseudogymnoascus destructans]|uniref:Uncharacterized protein n=1 Tax=Pseudogymnoascus destructans TaxID=655981 RepID=A0A177A3N5_9PEZI|nr:uncharacterized protein VC83_07024 [Pseudogymnoascus destructans]OAF56875.1 hypothetical protein VC83_07024 [Pseudogymnoascus destructans]